jgi:hypothetical protein
VALETWLQRNGAIAIVRNKEVLPLFLEQFAHSAPCGHEAKSMPEARPACLLHPPQQPGGLRRGKARPRVAHR